MTKTHDANERSELFDHIFSFGTFIYLFFWGVAGVIFGAADLTALAGASFGIAGGVVLGRASSVSDLAKTNDK